MILSRYTWTILLRDKSKFFDFIGKLFRSSKKNLFIFRIHSDHRNELKNTNFSLFYDEKGIYQEFSNPITSQQNGVVKRKK